MPKFKIARIDPGGSGAAGGNRQERIIELPAGFTPPMGAELVSEETPVSEEWRDVDLSKKPTAEPAAAPKPEGAK